MDPIKFLSPARLAFLALIVLPFALCTAQDKPAGEAAPAPQLHADPHAITIDFPGGPLSKLVASLAADKQVKLSIIQAEGLDPVLPAFSVHNATTESLLIALMRLVEPQGCSLIPTGPGLAVLSRNSPTKPPGFASFQLEGKINARSGRTAEDVIAAIQMGCEFADPAHQPSTLRFKYHPGTKLLFVAGSLQDIDVARQVFVSLPDGPAKEPPAPPEKK